MLLCLVVTDISGQIICPILKCRAVQEERCVTSQKSEDLIYAVAEAWNHKYWSYFVGITFRKELLCEDLYT
jgi:hypothetical protein